MEIVLFSLPFINEIFYEQETKLKFSNLKPILKIASPKIFKHVLSLKWYRVKVHINTQEQKNKL